MVSRRRPSLQPNKNKQTPLSFYGLRCLFLCMYGRRPLKVVAIDVPRKDQDRAAEPLASSAHEPPPPPTPPPPTSAVGRAAPVRAAREERTTADCDAARRGRRDRAGRGDPAAGHDVVLRHVVVRHGMACHVVSWARRCCCHLMSCHVASCSVPSYVLLLTDHGKAQRTARRPCLL